MIKKFALFISIFTFLFGFGQQQSSRFKQLSMNEGLSQTSVSCILKDSRGLMWFGTEDGLNKYDGTSFTIYRHDPDNSESLSSSYINDIVEDRDGFLWIATQNGLNYFNPETETFQRYYHDPNNKKSISHNEIHTLLKIDDKRLVLGTLKGVDVFSNKAVVSRYVSNFDNKTFHNVIDIVKDNDGALWVLYLRFLEKIKVSETSMESSFVLSLKNSFNHTLHLDASNVWIGSDSGLVRLNKQTKATQTFNFYESYGYKDKRNNVLSILKTEHEHLWLGTLEGGLISYDITTGESRAITHTPFNRLGLNSNSIRSLYSDDTHILWVGTYGGGINKYDPNQFEFEHYRLSPNDEISLSENTIRSVLHDSDGELWIGTHGGLNRVNRATNKVTVYKNDLNDLSTISSNTVRALKEGDDGIIWIGTWNDGLNSFDKRTGRFTRYNEYLKNNDSLRAIRTLETDKTGNLWIGGHGLWKMNTDSKEIRQYLKTGSTAYIVTNIFFDKNEILWVGTYQNGVIRFDPKSGAIKKYKNNSADVNSLSHNYITSIAQDGRGLLWIGTYGGGLNSLDPVKEEFKRYNISNGLLNDVIYGVAIDSQDFIWFSSNAGLSRLDQANNEFKYFGVDSGIQSEEFNAGAYTKSSQGELFFGGINGLNAFRPEALNKNKNNGQLLFTEFTLLDETTKPSSNEILEKHISRLDTIRLKHDQNSFSIGFSELNYANTVDNNYEYQLKGAATDWQHLGQRKIINFGNLAPGNYLLTTRITSDPNKIAKLFIAIAPPIWRTNMAYLIYTLLFIGLGLLMKRYLNKIQVVKEQFEAKIKSLENDIDLSSQLIQNNSIKSIPLQEVNASSINQKFLKRAVEIIEEHMENSSFDVQDFADEMFMSRSQLYRKLKTITGHSTTKFIRLIRLKRAAQLLSKNSASVSEIAYKVGFDNVSYFSKCFNETFGKPPSQYPS